MFPRRYYPGRYCAPRYWPQSQGLAIDLGGRRRTACAAVLSRTACAST